MSTILYFTSEIGINTFPSSSKHYMELKNICTYGEILIGEIKDEVCSKIVQNIDSAIKKRYRALENNRYITTYKRTYRGISLNLTRSREDLYLMIWLDLLDLFIASNEIKIFEFPSFDNKTITLLSKLKNVDIVISDIEYDVFENLKKYNLINVNENMVSLRSELKMIPFM